MASSHPSLFDLQPWPDLPGESQIARAVGGAAFTRAEAYARSGRVNLLTSDPHQRVLFAEVAGSGRNMYQTFVRVGGANGSPLSTGNCTCPVRLNCKHVAAVLLTALHELGPDISHNVPEWERLLHPLVGEPRSEYDGVPIGLLFEPAQVRGRAGQPDAMRLRLRPVVPGKRAAWTRGGIGWSDLAYRHPETVEAHREALNALYQSHNPSRYAYRDTPVHLDEFGPSLWPLLRSVAEAGVAFVDSRAGAGIVALSPTPATLYMDLTAGQDGRLTGKNGVEVPGVDLGSAVVAATVGEPAHGVVVDFVQEDTAPLGNNLGLVLAPLERPLSRQAAQVLDAGTIEVPAGDTPRFLTEYYPVLSRTIPVRSSDGSVDLPVIEPPKLAVRLDYRDAHELGLEWSFRYEVAGEVIHHPLAGPVDSGRDRGTEDHLLRTIRLPHSLRVSATNPAPQPVLRLLGMDAARFTEEVVPQIEAQGVVVEVVGTAPVYRRSEAAPVIRLSATESEDTGADRDADWFDLGISVNIDGEPVPFERLFVALSRGESHLVLDSGTYFELDRPELEQLRALIEEARQLQDHASDGLRLSVYQADLWEELAALGIVEEQSERWEKSIATLLAGESADPPAVPAGILADLRGYQVEGFQWLSHLWDGGLGGILADDMGLGKTLQVLATITRAQETGSLTAPALVVAPTSVVGNWAAEAERYAPGLKVVTLTQTQRKSKRPLVEAVADADLVVTSYAIFRLDEDAYRQIPWTGLILDEAQFVKNHQAKTYQVARRLRAPFKVAITGTPLENSLMDLWSLLSIVAPGMFPDPKTFTEVYRKPIEQGTSPELLATLRRRIRPFIRRRSKEQVAPDLPEKVEQVLHVQLNPKHRKVYDTYLHRERQKVLSLLDDVDKNRFTILRSLTLLRQLSLDAGIVDQDYAQVRSSKADVFLEHLEEVIGGGHRALVFSQFTSFLGVVRSRLEEAGIEYCYLDGSTRKRAQVVEEFRSGDAPVFLISLKAGGFGLNLTEADYCFVLDPWWNPAAEAQAVDRTHRIGQHKSVMVYRMVAEDTIEEKVLALQERKRDLFAQVIDDGGELSTPLSASDIRQLLTG